MPFRIGVDLDGVLADMESALARLQLTEHQQRRLWRHVQSLDRFWETLPEIEPGSVAALERTALERRWETVFLTTRPEVAGPTA